jgi:hypothetical protein
MGDFNHGPAIAESQAYFADSFRTVLNAGYRSPYTEKSSQCTWCTSNPLVAKASLSTAILGRSGIIDHIYVQNERSVSGIEVRLTCHRLSYFCSFHNLVVYT